MRTLHLVLAVVVSACEFTHGELVVHDAPPVAIDAPIDARANDASIDARSCPPPPIGCTSFTCSSTSSCYYLCGSGAGKATWGGAVGICSGSTFGGCIATINSQDEQNCVTLSALPTNSNPVWFGYRQDPSPMEPAGNWQWECGPSAYVQPGWNDFSGQPDNNPAMANCGLLVFGGLWTDDDCTGTARYICEVP